MPKARAYDGGHTVFTDHSIPRQPAAMRSAREAVGELSPYFRRTLPAALAQRNLALAYASAGAIDKAWPLLRAAVQSKPQDPALYTQVALYLEADGRHEQAIEFYRMAIDLDSEHDTALARLGLLLSQRGATAEARALLHRALARNPRQPTLRKALAGLKP
jgi:chemotaxis protein methyltransferase WspC